jgi:uncharacterized metal-binding protein YceD (DUF177 family)
MKKGETFGKEFLIPFGGEKLGKHEHHFEIGKAFFESGLVQEELDIIDSNIHLEFVLEKQSAMLNLFFHFSGSLTIPCDRCTMPLDLPIESSDTLFAKFSKGGFETTDDVITIPDSDSHIDIGPYVYEFLMLALPMKRSHNESDCDPSVIKKLEQLKPDDEESIDPRWDALKKLK